MSDRNYWLDLFTGTTWQEFLDAGGEVTGFRDTRWATAQKIKPGDYFLCYLTGVSRFIGLIEVTSKAFRDNTLLWKDELFPVRFKCRILVALTPETALPVKNLSDRLSMFQNMSSPIAWTGSFRGSPAKWKESDADVVIEALEDAKRNPVSRPVDPLKLARRPTALRAKIGAVTVPDGEEETPEPVAMSQDSTAHTEIQHLLLKLGCEMGLDVWVARNDRGRSFKGSTFIDLPRLKTELPLQFDAATTRTIELIDVLWLKGNAIVAAFEIESTTSIYSGLLRMSDLISMQPNLNIPLYLVAPDDRREKVFSEVNRPTFTRLNPPLVSICRYMPFSSLKEKLAQIGDVIRYLRPEFLEEISESCEVEEA
ncbi:MAG: hypothetical protein Kow00121_26580 [Elainellaceae cyanobacterium]